MVMYRGIGVRRRMRMRISSVSVRVGAILAGD